MRINKSVSFLAVLAALAGAFWLIQGCEKEPSTTPDDLFGYSSADRGTMAGNVMYPTMTIKPSGVDLTALGQQYLFTVTGGSAPYTWSVSRNTGTITPRPGTDSQAIYTCTELGPNEIVVSDHAGRTAIAAIVRRITPLSIMPQSATVTDGGSVSFKAVGGLGPYTWSATYGSRGSLAISGTENENAVYTDINGVETNNVNSVSVADLSGLTASASVK